MARRTVALVFVIALSCLAGCVDVPEGIRADFAAPTPQERSNFRQGPHGSAKPVVEVAQPSPVSPSAPPAATTTPEPKAAEADAGAAGDTTSTTTVTGAPQ